jgi:quinol monooxygenase YgiN
MAPRGLIAQFQVAPADLEAFLAAAKREMVAVQADEPYCLRFDVIVFDDELGHGAFIEVFRDESAAERHRETPHFKAFFEEISGLAVNWSARRGYALSPN